MHINLEPKTAHKQDWKPSISAKVGLHIYLYTIGYSRVVVAGVVDKERPHPLPTTNIEQ